MLQLIAFFLYLAAASVIGIRIFSDYNPPLTVAKVCWLIALIAHAATIKSSIFVGDGLSLSVLNVVSITVLLLAAILFISCLRQALEFLALPILPVTALLVLLLGVQEIDPTRIMSGLASGMKLHITFSLLANSVLLLVATLAIVLHWQATYLRRGDNNILIKSLPPIEATESFLFNLLITGLILLTLSLVSGWFYLENMLTQHLMHKTLLSITSWIVLAALFVGHLLFGWRGERFLRLTLTGTVLLIIAYLGSKIMLELVLDIPKT